MKIALDVMGSDLGPEAIIKGGILAAKENIEVILVGIQDEINKILANYNTKNLPIFVKHASEVVGMDESPSKVIKNKKDSSIAVGLNLVKEGNAKAFISAGNTGAVLGYSIFILKRLKNIIRPAIAATFPSVNGYVVVLDVGGNVNCKPEHLLQFAIMGAVYAKIELNIENPKICLLSNGEEESKGLDVLKKANFLLKKSSLNYVGFKEGRDIFQGNSDVFVCDGFVGNICLKLAEGMGKTLMDIIKKDLSSSFFRKIGLIFLKKLFKDIKKKLDYREYGAAPLIGVNEIVMICHGSSDEKAIYNGIKRAKILIEKGFNKNLSNELEKNSDLEKNIWKTLKHKIWHHKEGEV